MRRLLLYIFQDVNEAVRAVVGGLVNTSESEINQYYLSISRSLAF